MALMVTVICANCSITSELELVITALAYASPSNSHLCVFIPWTIVYILFISSWYSSGGGGGPPYMFCTAAVYPPFPAVVTSNICYLCAQWGKYCSMPMLSGWWFNVSTLCFFCLTLTSMPKGWSFWTPSWSCQSSNLLLARIISPFLIVLSIRPEVPRGFRDPSSLQNFPRGQFRLSPCSPIKGVGAWWMRTPVQTLLASPPVGIGIMVPPSWWSAF